jgi:two-component system, chemotaxis family, chemotaxis protein CheY
MTLAETLLRQLDDPALTPDERAQLRCRAAEAFERRGQYEAARDALGELWQGTGQRPPLEDLSERTAAEVLLRVGALSGWFGSVRQLKHVQEAAKDLISESIARFQELGEATRVAAARSELGLCYRRAGSYNEARMMYHEALNGLSDNSENELRAEILKRLAVVESASGRYNEALCILTDAAKLFDKISDDALRGKFHNDLACVFVHLSRAERRAEHRQDYGDRAIIEYTAATYHFEQAGHIGYRASAESNLGFLHYVAGRYQQAHEHLDRARSLFLSVKDRGRIAQVDDARARVLLAQGRKREAERVIREAVRTLEKGDEQALLAEALTTQGLILAKLGQFPESRNILKRAANLAEIAGTVEDAGLALLTLLEEHGERITEYELLDTYQRADNLLSKTQDAETIARLRACASRIVSARLAVVQPRRVRSLADFWSNFNLLERARAYEARYIKRALIEAEGSVTRAARLLGLQHHATLTSMLARRHRDLAHLRTPPEKRPRSIIRIRALKETRGRRTSKARHSITILHVEDNEIVASTIKETLELAGWSIETCMEAAAAQDKLAGSARYDLLIFDNDLPGTSGLKLIEYARRLPHLRRTPIIMLAATDLRAEALSAGADAFLKKPEDMSALTETVQRLLDSQTKEH